MNAPKTLWHPVLVIVDEAHVFCPQKGEAESAGAVIDLAMRGRKRGFCAVLATQRLSKLHKDAAAECNNKLIGRTGLDVDMKRAADELGFSGREDTQRLRRLEPGQFFAFGPALSAEVRQITIGAVQTTHPKAGSRLAFSPPPPTAKIKALLPKLADLPAEAEQRAATEADLRKELAQVRRELTLAQRAGGVQVQEKVIEKPVEVPVVGPEALARIEATVGTCLDLAKQLQATATGLWDDARSALEAARSGPRHLPTVSRVAAPPAVTQSSTRGPKTWARPVAPAAVRRAEGGESLTGPEQRILDALAWLEAIGVTDPEQPAVAFLAGYKYGGGAYNNPRGSLRVKGLLEYRGDRLALTEAGRALAHTPDAPLTVDELHQRVLARLPGPEQRLLRPLLEAYPNPMSNEELARAANYEPGGGAYNNPRGRLRSLGLIDYTADRRVVAKRLLFLET